MDVPLHLLLPAADFRRGGVTRSALRRARLLGAHTGRPVHVLAFNYSTDFDRLRSKLRSIGLIDDHVLIHNLFEDLETQSAERAKSQPGRTGEVLPVDPPDPFADTSLQRREKRTKQDVLTSTEYLDAKGRVVGIVRWDPAGRMRRVDTVAPPSEVRTESRFFDRYGRCYLILRSDPTSGTSVGARLLDGEGGAVRTYESENELRIDWVRGYADRHELSVFQSEWRTMDPVLTRLDRASVVKVKAYHLNHLAAPYVYGSPLRRYADADFCDIDAFDAFVLLTPRQLEDVARQFGPRTTYHAVGNVVSHPAPGASVIRDPYKAVCVGRYRDTKRWDRAIDAFRTVVDTVPQATLELWGFGPERDALRAQIARLGLERSVFLKGMTHDSVSVFASAAFSVLTSPSEGFPLSIGESMAAGTPVVAFDVLYGVAEQIESGIDGVLVTPGDIDALARAMIRLFTHQDERQAMSEAALRKARTFDESTLVEDWLRVYHSAIEQQRHRVDLGQPTCDVTSVRVDHGAVSMEGTVRVDAPAHDLRLSLYLRSRGPRASHVDRYQELIRQQPVTDGTIAFAAEVPVSLLLAEHRLWEFSLSCSCRNAHRFVSLRGDPRRRHRPLTLDGHRLRLVESAASGLVVEIETASLAARIRRHTAHMLTGPGAALTTSLVSVWRRHRHVLLRIVPGQRLLGVERRLRRMWERQQMKSQ